MVGKSSMRTPPPERIMTRSYSKTKNDVKLNKNNKTQNKNTEIRTSKDNVVFDDSDSSRNDINNSASKNECVKRKSAKKANVTTSNNCKKFT